MQLTEHFSLEELIQSQTATRLGLDNTPDAQVIAALGDTAEHLEQVRAILGVPIIVTSGYRSFLVNQAVHGVPSSAHLTGHAADWIAPQFGTPLAICVKLAASDLLFDQLIEEGTWVHTSFAVPMRRMVLTKAPSGGYELGLPR